MVHCALRKQLGGWQRGEHRDEKGLYPNWDVPGYLRFDLIHQLITTISRRWCGTKAEITAPWRTTGLLTVCERAYVYDRQAPIRHRDRYVLLCLHLQYDQKGRQTNWQASSQALPPVSPQQSCDRSSVLSWGCHITHSHTHTHTHTHTTPSHPTTLQPC